MTREEAIEVIKAKADYLESDKRFRAAVETIIPELRESEDERIRKEIVDFIRWAIDRGSITKEQREKSDTWFSYLEKQKECVSNNFDDVWNEEDCEEIIAEGQKLTPRFRELLKEVCHTWYDRGVKLKKQKETGIQWLKSDNVKNPDKPYIDKAGIFYTTDGRMCYASEIEKQKGETLKDFIDNFPYSAEQEEQKPVEWSKEDDNHFHSIYHYLRFLKEDSENESVKNDIEKHINWFCRLYQTPPKQDKREWSEKDEKMRERLITGLTWITYNTRTDSTSPNITFFDEINWLKSLPLNLKKKNEDVAKLCSNEWSKEDDDFINMLILHFNYLINKGGDSVETYKSYIENLKSLRPSWKPSEEQMKWLKDVIETVPMTCRQQVPLESLYNDLLKLM